MTVNELQQKLSLEAVALPDGDRDITGCYIGDLLSWVMSAAKTGNIWITIMSNINIVAVAALCDTACIVLADGVTVDEEIKTVALSRGVNILSSKMSAYSLAAAISGFLS